MSPTRREALVQLAALSALPLGALDADRHRSARRHHRRVSGGSSTRRMERGRSDHPRARSMPDRSARSIARSTRSPTPRSPRRAPPMRVFAVVVRAGPLDGVPVFAKAIYDVNGLPTTGSSAEWARLFPEQVTARCARGDASARCRRDRTWKDRRRRLRLSRQRHEQPHRTGAQSARPHRRRTRPADRAPARRSPSRRGMAFAALGTDDGGSNRIPAQFTGVVGMKPTFGLVPRTGVIPTWPYLDTHGPLARTVADAALLLAAIAGPDASDPLALTRRVRRRAVRRAA